MKLTSKHLLASGAVVALLVGCAGGAGGEEFSTRSLNPLSRNISAMDKRLVESAKIAVANRSAARTGNAPRTFFYSGQVESTSGNYWLAEKQKAPVDLAGRVIYDASVTQYLNDMARRLTAKLPATAPKPRVHLLASPSYEAIAMPTGDVFLSVNMLALAQSEDEIAAILGHEIGHIMLSHHDKDALFARQRDATALAVEGIAAAGYFSASAKSGTLFKGGTMPTALQASVREDTAAMAGTKALIDFVGNDVVGAAWGREQELDADLYGLDLMADAGYNPVEFDVGMEQLAEGYESRKGRLQSLEALAEKRGEILEGTISTAMSQGDLNSAVTAIAAEGVGLGLQAGAAAFSDFRSYVADTHTDPTVRREQGFDYIERFYDEDLPDPKISEWSSRKIALRIDALNEAYFDIDKALQATAEEDFTTALGLVRSAYSKGSIQNDPFPRLVEAIAHEGLGDSSSALNALRSVSPSSPMSLQAYIMLAQLETANRSGASAISALDRAQGHYGVAAIQDARITTLAQLGRAEEARKAYTDCAALGETVQKRCRTAAESAGLIEARPKGLFGNLFQSAETPAQTSPSTPAQSTGSLGGLGTLLGTSSAPSTPVVSPAPAPAADSKSVGSPLEGLGSALSGLGGALF